MHDNLTVYQGLKLGLRRALPVHDGRTGGADNCDVVKVEQHLLAGAQLTEVAPALTQLTTRQRQ